MAEPADKLRAAPQRRGAENDKSGQRLDALERRGDAEARRAAFLSARRAGPEPIQSRLPNRTGLPDELKAGVETLSGVAMEDVKVRYDSPGPAQLQADAYTQRSEIHVASGQECHLAHEAWHVVQQKRGRVRPTIQAEGVAINDDAALEREADAMGARATAVAMSDGHAAREEPRAAGAVAQRKVTVGADVFDDVSKTKALVDKIVEAVGAEWDKALGGTLAKMIKNNAYAYADYRELFEALRAMNQGGAKSQEVGKERETRVAEQIGGQVADAGKYGQDEVVHYMQGGKPTDRHVKLDVKSASVFGIVGGAAKARNLIKFRNICHDLKAIAEQNGKAPQVFCDRNTPYGVARAAADIVGEANVIDAQSGNPLFETGPAFDAGFAGIDGAAPGNKD